MATKKKAATGTRKSGPNQSAFIRQHLDLPTADVVAKGKEAGLDFSPAFVAAVRSKVKGATTAKAGASAKPSRRKRGPRPKNVKTSASDFIRAQPQAMKAKDVVDAAVNAGFKKFGTNLVYLVRSKMAAYGSKAKGRPGRKPRAGAKAPTAGVAAFKRMAFDLGIPTARRALDELERGLTALLA